MEMAEDIKSVGTADVANIRGNTYGFGPMGDFPAADQKPPPPIILGGSGPKILERVVRYADGWMPNRGRVIERIPELQELAQAAGRDRIPVTYYPKASADEIERLAAAGVDRLIWYVPPDGRDAALKKLDELGEMVRPYLKDELLAEVSGQSRRSCRRIAARPRSNAPPKAASAP